MRPSSFLRKFAAVLIGLSFCATVAVAQFPTTNDPPSYGPFNGVFLADGDGLKKNLVKDDSVLRADSPWTLYCWIHPSEIVKSQTLVAGVGNTDDDYPRYLAIDANKAIFWMGKDNSLSATAKVSPDAWHLLAAT